MRKTCKKVLSLLLALVMMLGMLPAAAFAVEPTSGTCGDNLTWTLENGVLTISGKGKMKDYGVIHDYDVYREAPWPNITAADIRQGVTSIGVRAFCHSTSLTSVIIPNSVISIGDEAFYNCTSLVGITIPESVIDIGKNAFISCISLTSVTIPNSVTSIGSCAFERCTSLASVTLPDDVTWISDGTFMYCENLTSVTIPNKITNIGEAAFFLCDSLKDVYYAGTESQWKAINIDIDNDPLTSATIHYNSTGAGSEPAKPDEGASEASIMDETVLQAKRLLHSDTFSFYRNWASPVQNMAKQLAGTPSVTWYTIENFTDIYYKSAKNGDLSTNDVGEATTVEFYEYLLFKLLDSKELEYFSITEPFGFCQ